MAPKRRSHFRMDHIVAVLEHCNFGPLELHMGGADQMRRMGVPIASEHGPDELVAVLNVPVGCTDTQSRELLVEALELTARCAVDVATASGTFVARYHGQEKPVCGS